MRLFRHRALAALGLGAALPFAAPAQAPTDVPVGFDTPRSEVARLAQVAHTGEMVRGFLKVSFATMGMPVPMAKRLAPKSDYYEAWLSRLADRTFPNETIPEDLYLRATQQRLAMPPAPATAFGSVTSATAASGLATRLAPAPAAATPRWQLIGPTRTQVPYVIYYGPANSYVSGRVGGIAFDPTDPKVIYMTGAAGGVFKTVNGGTNWTNMGGITSPYVGPIAVSPTNRNLVIVGAGDYDGGAGPGNGFYRSTDAGATWAWIQPTSITNVAFSKIVFDATTPGRILASAGRRGTSNGLWESLDSGLTWTKVSVAGSTTLSLSTVSAGATAPNGDRPMIASGSTIYDSRDAGRTWTAIASYPGAGGNNVAVASPTDPNVAYASNSGQRKVYKGVRAADGTWTWSDITTNLPSNYNWSQSGYDFHIHAARHTVNGVVRDTVYVGLITVAAWDGTSWTDIGATYTGDAKTHNDQHTFAVFPGDSTKMAIGNDGGIYGLTIAPNGAHTIDARVNGDATMAMFYSGAWYPTNASKMFGGTQDNASPTAIGDLANWANRTGGDGTGAAIDFVNPNRQYGASQYLGMYRTLDAWTNPNAQFGINYDFNGGDPSGAPFIGRFACDVSPQGYLYIGGNSRLFRYDPAADSVTPFLGSQTFVGQLRAIAPAPSDPNVLYVGTNNGYLYQSRDRGATWRTLATGGGLGAILSVSVHPTKPYDVLFTTGGGNFDTHVYRIADASAATPAFVPVSGAGGGKLPNITASSVCRNLKGTSADATWYVSTDVGVFGTTTAGGAWFNMTEPLGLPPVEGATIEHTLGTGYLNLATYGRGMWRLKIDDVKTPASLSVVSASLARTASNVIALTLTIRNTGDLDASLARVTGANAFFDTGYGYAPFTPLPLQLGAIPGGATKVATITYKDAALRKGRNGVVFVKIDWRSGTTTYPIQVELPVTLP